VRVDVGVTPLPSQGMHGRGWGPSVEDRATSFRELMQRVGRVKVGSDLIASSDVAP